MNLEDQPTTYFRRNPETDANRIYGGVLLDAERGRDLFDLDPVLATYFLTVDLSLSAVADTLTLPITITSTLEKRPGHLNVVESPSGGSTSRNETDQPSSATQVMPTVQGK